MSCNITRSRGIDCKTAMSGIKAIYLAEFSDMGAVTYGSGEITDIAGVTGGLYKYDLRRGAGSVVETYNISNDTGAFHFQQALNIKLGRLTKEDQNEIKLLSKNRLVVFVELNELVDGSTNNHIIALGTQNGVYLDGGTGQTGAASGDANGYDLNLSAEEPIAMPFLTDYTDTPFDNIDSSAAITVN